MRPGTKSSIYTLEVTEAAVKVVLQTIERFQNPNFKPKPLDYSKPDVRGQLRPTMQQQDRTIDWQTDDTDTILDKIRAADGSPGVLDTLLGEDYYLYGATEEDNLRGKPGELIATQLGAICRATIDGAIWISHLKRKTKNGDKPCIKLPASQMLAEKLTALPKLTNSIYNASNSFKEIWYEEKNDVGYLHFDFHNGAMSTDQCHRFRDAVLEVRQRRTRILVLLGGRSSWSNGIHLNVIEAANDPAEESWRNINAIDDLVYAILTTTNKITIAGVHGNAGAGGVLLALACDKICARAGVIFNPHYKGMGLFGSEYWTYTLPKKVGYEKALEITEACLPMGMQEAKKIGMVDYVIPEMFTAFDDKIKASAEKFAQDINFEQILENKRLKRYQDEFIKPLKYYRQEELKRMRDNFYQPASSYHSARQQFVYKKPAEETPERLCLHRQPAFNFISPPNKESGSSKHAYSLELNYQPFFIDRLPTMPATQI